jgi:fructokinase
VSAVGRDSSAQEVRQKMSQHGLDLSGLQTNDYPTGQVEVSLDDGEPSYEIVPEQAYDFLCTEGLQGSNEGNAPNEFAIIYHGSLIWRSPTSRATVRTLRSTNNASVFVDLNIRMPWFLGDQVGEMLTNVDSLKLNIDELIRLSGQKLTNKNEIRSAASDLLEDYSIRSMWVTAGDRGAYFFDNAGRAEFAQAPDVETVVDTVGAGDAFSAAVIDGLMLNQPPDAILANAVQFAARVCRLQGATTTDAAFYQHS